VKILAIESSCDETSVAVIEPKDNRPFVVAQKIASQIYIHKEFGGVVPEVAARAHIEEIIPATSEVLAEAKVDLKEIDRIAVTAGPGLIGSLAVGVMAAKALSQASGIPLFPINHLEGHIYANFIFEPGVSAPEFPILALLVSGGHTMLINMPSHNEYQVIGQTRDDAAGEAFDKGAKMLGLPYPGGPEISKRARLGNPNKYPFPIIDLTPEPYRDQNGFLAYPEKSLDFSFSGLKTALLNLSKKVDLTDESVINDLCASFEKGIVRNLLAKTDLAVEKFKPKTLILSGGVAANEKLRTEIIDKFKTRTEVLVPKLEYCTDNAAMIGAVAFYRKADAAKLSFGVEPSLKLN
jgi:N6-L-threonylcarbamoyladenine synthase